MTEYSLEFAFLLSPLLLFLIMLLAQIWSRFIDSLMEQVTRTFDSLY